MTPPARVAAAAELLDLILAGTPAEQALTRWARASRFAGSGDRAAVRDLVFSALRMRRSLAARAGAPDAPGGRALMIGLTAERGEDPDTVFTGTGHAPRPLTGEERARLVAPAGPATEAAALDVPDWTLPLFRETLGAACASSLLLMRQRAPLFLRVNLGVGGRDDAIARLAAEGISAVPVALCATALRVTGAAERVRRSAAYLSGLVELQDAASQAACAMVPLKHGARILDLCAGGGGKTLALAARAVAEDLPATFFVHDTNPARMRDIRPRATRAGLSDRSRLVDIRFLATSDIVTAGPFDLVLVDAPCTGSGTWARTPDAKWRATPDSLAALCAVQSQLLESAEKLVVSSGGAVAYMTCSLFAGENVRQVRQILARRPGWRIAAERQFAPQDGADGFYIAVITGKDS
ncbi:MAG: RsmB/NOP family class I SAM-dependent RNA methyltransferase [Pseudomonadota bacterium]